jgi:hypothetical protein
MRVLAPRGSRMLAACAAVCQPLVGANRWSACTRVCAAARGVLPVCGAVSSGQLCRAECGCSTSASLWCRRGVACVCVLVVTLLGMRTRCCRVVFVASAGVQTVGRPQHSLGVGCQCRSHTHTHTHCLACSTRHALVAHGHVHDAARPRLAVGTRLCWCRTGLSALLSCVRCSVVACDLAVLLPHTAPVARAAALPPRRACGAHAPVVLVLGAPACRACAALVLPASARVVSGLSLAVSAGAARSALPVLLHACCLVAATHASRASFMRTAALHGVGLAPLLLLAPAAPAERACRATACMGCLLQ